jgi:SAM-dependent methyltransferase
MHRLFLELHRRSRDKKHRLFLQLLRPEAHTRILNVGATGMTTGLQEQFECKYRHPEHITGGGPSFEETFDYCKSFPEVTPIVFDGCALPFADKSFDIVYSNAVLEHLPRPDDVVRFASEVQRVGQGWFITTPNFWYPIEPHYHLPLVQLLPQEGQRNLVTRLGKTPYDHLRLLRKSDLRELFPTSTVLGCRVTFYPETLIAYRSP